ncbi:hypothetical protein BG262_09305 [Floricoccus penangensis]|uniref:histidine kinase n=1 Tax=Floricoccus penangensis TaxID=1859475 RepID=A0A9Q5JHZ0_9LACT|nr:hypothetical protein BG262_09305 [Floricoccus penangensis]
MKKHFKFIIFSIVYICTTILLTKSITTSLLNSEISSLEKKLDQIVQEIKDGNRTRSTYTELQIFTDDNKVPEDVQNVFKGSAHSNAIIDGNLYVSTPLTVNGKTKEVIRIGEKLNVNPSIFELIFIYSAVIYLFILFYYLNNKSSNDREISEINKIIARFHKNPYQELRVDSQSDPILDSVNNYSSQVYAILNDKNQQIDNILKLINTLDFPVFIYDDQGSLITSNGSFKLEFPHATNISYFKNQIEFLNFLVSNLVDSNDIQGEFYFEDIDKYFQVKISNIDNLHGNYIVSMLDVSEPIKAKISQDNFIANVSHELKTPLTSIIGFSDAITTHNISQKQVHEFSLIIKKEAERLENLVNDTLKLTKNNIKIQKTEVQANEVVDDILSKFYFQIEEKKLHIDKRLRNIYFLTNYDLFYGIAKNIIENAIFYTKNNGRIYISLNDDNDNVYLTVKDNGIGISIVDQERIFERFYRVDEARSTTTNGTGLGLAIVKHNAKYLNARISMISKLDLGTKITIIFPK